ncbi:MAG: D-alanine--D-alanine ligase [Oscillospiraceae bacterium]|nr:D-alanine--D-alanine ligase [Oscillospiraceae bacterium]
MAKLKIAVLFGGASSEHEVSLVSAYTVLTNIPRDKYDVFCIGITKKGHWMYYPGEYEDIKTGKWEGNPDCCTAVLSPDSIHKGFIVLGSDGAAFLRKADVVFPVLHGMNGEDGTVQGLCRLAGMPCVGCDMTASAVCMDKTITHKVLEYAGIKTAPFIELRRNSLKNTDEIIEKVKSALGFPVYVKPACAGSSVGVSRAENTEELRAALKIAFAHGDKVLVEREIIGKEVECAVLGNGHDIIASIPGQITPAEKFYDYDAKYKLGTSVLDIPAKISEKQTEELRETAKKAYIACGCSGFSRVDFFVCENEIILNEINTIPGFTSISMYPKLMDNMGIPIGELIDRLIQLAVNNENN